MSIKLVENYAVAIGRLNDIFNKRQQMRIKSQARRDRERGTHHGQG